MKKLILLVGIGVTLFGCAATEDSSSQPNLPVVVTTEIIDITGTSAIANGEVTSDGGSAILERGFCWSLTSNPTISDATVQEAGTTGTITAPITGLSAESDYYVKAYAKNINGVAYGNQLTFSTPEANLNIARCNGTTLTTIVEITSPTGKKWMDRNLGATQAATNSNDPKAYGCLFQWGRGNDDHASVEWTSATTATPINGTTTTLATTNTPGTNKFIVSIYDPFNNKWADWRSPKNDLLWQGAAGVNNPCPTNFRLPTESEWSAEFTAYSITNSATAFNSALKLAKTSYRDAGVGTIAEIGVNGAYWSSTVYTNFSQGQYTIYKYFDNNSVDSRYTYRGSGQVVRCIKN